MAALPATAFTSGTPFSLTSELAGALPHVMLHILTFSSAKDLYSLQQTCKPLHLASLSEEVWRCVTLQHNRGRLLTGEAPETVKPLQDCWRAEAYRRKRAIEYQKALSSGRAGRISSTIPPFQPIHFLSADAARAFEELASRAAAKGTAEEGAGVPATSLEKSWLKGDSAEDLRHRSGRLVARQGSCSWSVLGKASSSSEDSGSGSVAAAGGGVEERKEG